MGQTSAIEWTDATWNPTTGCDRVSPGCDNCYALRMAGRLKLMGSPRYQRDGDSPTSGPGFGIQTHWDALDVPRRWRRPRKVFVDSMSDLFHARVPFSFLDAVFAVMHDTPQHTYQLLTKRSSRLPRLAPRLSWPPNLWLGVSVESAAELGRIGHLTAVPATVRFVSAEPLLGPLTGIDLSGVDWVIAGGESGPHHRDVDPQWVRELRDRCAQTDTAFFFKQWGGRRPKTGGRVLDGRTWDELPHPDLTRLAPAAP